MPQFYLQSATLIGGTAWTGTAPGGTAAASGTVTTNLLGSIEFSAIEFNFETDEIDFTHFASAGWKVMGNGLQSGTLSFTANDGYSAAELDAVFGLGGSLGPGTSPIYLDLKPTSASRSTTNPSYVMRVLNTGGPMGGSVGSKAERAYTLRATGLIARLTS